MSAEHIIIALLQGMAVGTLVAVLFNRRDHRLAREALAARHRAEGSAACWRKRYSSEQLRFDQLRTLYERLHELDSQSAAARPHELRDIERSFRELCPPMPTRRNEP